MSEPNFNIVYREEELHPEELSIREADRIYWKKYWSKIARIALLRFPELQNGETIYRTEIQKRLKYIEEAGYPVQPYSHLKKEDLWNYLMGIKKDVYKQAKKYCPNVLEEILERNEEQKESAWM